MVPSDWVTFVVQSRWAVMSQATDPWWRPFEIGCQLWQMNVKRPTYVQSLYGLMTRSEEFGHACLSSPMQFDIASHVFFWIRGWKPVMSLKFLKLTSGNAMMQAGWGQVFGPYKVFQDPWTLPLWWFAVMLPLWVCQLVWYLQLWYLVC